MRMSEEHTIELTRSEADSLSRFHEAVAARDRVLGTHELQSDRVHEAVFEVDWFYSDFLMEHVMRPEHEAVAEYLHYQLTGALFGVYPCCEEPVTYSHFRDCSGPVRDDCASEG